MPFRIVQNGPLLFGSHKPVHANSADRVLQVRNFKEEDGFVARWIGLGAFPFEANEASIAIELSVMPALFIRHMEAKRLDIELSSALKVVKVYFNSEEPC